MEHGEIGRIGPLHFTARDPAGNGVAESVPVITERSVRGDVVELTRPNLAVMRLLRQRVLDRTRDALELSDRLDAAVEQGMVDGTAETAEILHEIGDLDTSTWRLIGSVIEEFYRLLFGSGPFTRR